MNSQRIRSTVLAILMALVFVVPDFSRALAETSPAPTESATQAPAETSGAKKAKQYKVKFVDAVTGKAIGETLRVNAGEAAAAPEALDHGDLGFQFSGWSRDFSAVKKDLTVKALYASVHRMELGDFDAPRGSAGGKMLIALPVAFKNALSGDAFASNTLANGKAAGYDAKREIPEYDQAALQSQGIEWIRIDLDLSGTPLKAAKGDRSAYVMRSVKDSKKKYGIESGHPVNRGFAVFGKVKVKDGAKAGSYGLKGTIVWRMKGTKLDNEIPFEMEIKVGKAEAKTAEGTAAPESTAAVTFASDESDILVANRVQGDVTSEIHILGQTPTPAPTETPEAIETAEPAATPEAIETAEPTVTPEGLETIEPTVTPEGLETAEPAATPEATETAEPTVLPEGLETAEPAVLPEATESAEPAVTPEGLETIEPAVLPEALSTSDGAETVTPAATEVPEDATRDLGAADALGDDPAVAVLESRSLTAKDDGDTSMYTATFVDRGTTVYTATEQAGKTPSVPGDYVAGKAPLRRIDGVWNVFSGWDPPVSALTANMTYAAQYSPLPNSETITFIDGFDGATLGVDNKAEAEAAANAHAKYGFSFTGWEEAASLDSGSGTITVTATAQYTLTSVISVSPKSFPVGKPKGTVTIALPISYQREENDAPVFSDMLTTGKRAEKYTGKESVTDFNQSELALKGVRNMYIELDSFGDAPLTAASLSPAYVVKDGENQGYAVFPNITVKSSAENGFYTLTGKLYWGMEGQPEGKYSSMTFTTQVRVTGAASSSGGSYYGGGGGVTSGGTEKPQAKLVVEAITTDPLNPKAGEDFEVVLSLKNTSASYYVQNVEVTYTTEEDALMPTSGSNSVYIAKIDKSESFEQRLPVKASPELTNENVKIELAMEYEDKKLTALTATQSVMVKVQQVQRMQLDELQLPTTQTVAGDSADVSLGIFNLGRTVLYNVTAKVVCDNPNLMMGQSFFGGNMDPGTSKTAELEVTPVEGGQYNASVVVTYENAMGEVTTETRPFALTVAALEEMNYDEMMDYEEPEPEPQAPSAAEIMQYLPPWVYAAVGLILLAVILAIAMSARRRRRRMFEDDEMD